MINVVGDFSGANPKDKNIIKKSSFKFTLCPTTENKVESFRFEAKIVNTFPEKKEVELCIDWPVKEWAELKDSLFVKGEKDKDWLLESGEVKGKKTVIHLSVSPGETYVCLHPKYSYEECEKFVSDLKNRCLQKYIAGHSNEGRNIRCLEMTNPGIKKVQKRRVLIAARNHAYETSGNYCVEGMVNWLLSEDMLAKYSLSKFIFYFLPMTNPDGVANGLDRFTRGGGADLNRDKETNLQLYPGSLPDKSHETFFKALDKIKPSVFLNFHSYNFKHKDELYGANKEDIEKFITFMPDQIEVGKVWRRTVSDGKDGPLGYCRKKFGTTSFLIEVPWFGRNGEIMRETGVKIIRATILMNTLQDKSFRKWGELK